MFKSMKRIIKWAGKYKGHLYLGSVFSFFSSLSTAIPTMAAAYALDKAIAAYWAGNTIESSLIWQMLWIIVGSIALNFLLSYLRAVLQESIGYEVAAGQRIHLGDVLKRVPLGYFSKNSVGDILTGVTTELSTLELQGMKMVDIIINGYAKFIAILLCFLFLSPAAAVISVVGVAFSSLALHGISRHSEKTAAITHQAMEDMSGSAIEYIRGLSIVKSFGQEGASIESFRKANTDLKNIHIKVEKGYTPFNCLHLFSLKLASIGAVFGILSWLSCPLVILLAYAPWVAGTLNTVDYLLICMLPLFCAKLANSIFVDLTSYKNLMISKNKILSVMNELEETGSMEPLHTATHEITFDNVDFAYVPGEPVLKHATFTVPDQKLTAIVGDSGSGKSTILNLIAKYYEATSGTISIGGKPINHIAAERVLEQVSMVDQDVFLFDDTIRDNIRHARPNATDTEIEAACREANCDSFIRKMEKGYDTPTGENGNLLSGGERQRISIARAILKNSPILLLDEATASLDIENELAVKQAIANLLKEKKTVVMIAHTLSIVKNADQILVMGDGRIAESGTHEELLAKGGKYAAMWNAEQKISA